MAWARADSADLDSPHVIDRLPAFWPSSWSDPGRIDSPSGRGRSLFCAGADLLVVPLVGAAAAVEPLGVLGVPVPASHSFLFPVPVTVTGRRRTSRTTPAASACCPTVGAPPRRVPGGSAWASAPTGGCRSSAPTPREGLRGCSRAAPRSAPGAGCVAAAAAGGTCGQSPTAHTSSDADPAIASLEGSA
jgi:hypothetical protein